VLGIANGNNGGALNGVLGVANGNNGGVLHGLLGGIAPGP
ncbi:MAG: hypothetical protein QOD39_4061, partial [Mycobacterium sp.]|nr:hypothetical protein [Mycobacterium sp.]